MKYDCLNFPTPNHEINTMIYHGGKPTYLNKTTRFNRFSIHDKYKPHVPPNSPIPRKHKPTKPLFCNALYKMIGLWYGMIGAARVIITALRTGKTKCLKIANGSSSIFRCIYTPTNPVLL